MPSCAMPTCRFERLAEFAEYYRHGGITPYVMRRMLAEG